MEYASEVWCPHYKIDIENLEKVQRFAIRVCLRQWDLGRDELLSTSGLTTLEKRRLIARIFHMYKILHEMIDFLNSPVERRDILYNSRSVNGLSLTPIRFRTSMYQYSFFPHTVTLWNKLVSKHNNNIEDIFTLSVFKRFLHRMHFTSSY